MKAPKIKFDKATIQEFFLLHVEKMVLALVAVLLAFFVYSGTQLERMTEFTSPVELKSLTTTTQTTITNPENWNKLAEERTVEENVKEQAEAVTKPISGQPYHPPHVINPGEFPRVNPRKDPQVFPPKNLTVAAFYGPLALKRDQNSTAAGNVQPTDPLSDTLPTGLVPGMEGPGPGFAPGAESLPIRGGEGTRPPPGRNTGRGRNPGRAPLGPTEAYGYDDETFGMESPAMPIDIATPVGPRRFERDRGYVAGSDTNWITARAVVVQAVVPWKKEFEEFKACLAESADFSLERDLPNYLSYFVERADVTANPDADPATLKWETPLMANNQPYSTGYARLETYHWHGFPMEVLDTAYLDMELTHPAPPFMMRDLTAALTHPDIPLYEDSMAAGQPGMGEGPGGGPQQFFDALGNQIEAPEGVLPTGPTDISQFQQRAPFQHKMPADPRAGGESNMFRGTTNASIEDVEKQVQQYKLIRFTDVTVKAGRKYRYRIKVAMEDPNHPRDASMEPPIATMDDVVKLRLKDIPGKEKQMQRRIFWIDSEWSEASPAIGVPEVDFYYAANAEPPKFSPVRPDRPASIAKEAHGRIVSVTWDKKHSVDVPVVVEVERGSAVNFEGTAEVIHPALGSVRKLEDFKLHTTSVVADIVGSEEIAPQSRTTGTALKTPAEVLVFDDKGRWHMLNESRDVDEIQRQILDDSLLKDEAPAPRRPKASQSPNIPSNK